MFGVPESEVGLLGDVAGLDIVDLGCGTGYFSAWFAKRGGRPGRHRRHPGAARHRTAAAGGDRDRVSADRGERGGRARSRMRASTSPSRSTARASGATRTSGFRRRTGCFARAVASSSSRTARSSSCARSRTRKARPRRCSDRSADMHKIAWADGGVEFHLGHGDMLRVLRDTGFESRRSSSSSRPTARKRTSTTSSSPPTGRASGRSRRYGRRASPPDPRVDVAAAPRDPRAARHPVRRRRSRLRRGRPTRRRPDRARSSARGGKGAIRPHRRPRHARCRHDRRPRWTCLRQGGERR